MNFSDQAEYVFWKAVYLAVIRDPAVSHGDACEIADAAVDEVRKRDEQAFKGSEG